MPRNYPFDVQPDKKRQDSRPDYSACASSKAVKSEPIEKKSIIISEKELSDKVSVETPSPYMDHKFVSIREINECGGAHYPPKKK